MPVTFSKVEYVASWKHWVEQGHFNNLLGAYQQGEITKQSFILSCKGLKYYSNFDILRALNVPHKEEYGKNK